MNFPAYLESGKRQVVENESLRPIVVDFTDGLFLTLELLQSLLHPHHRVIVVLLIVRDATKIDNVCH